VRDVTTWPLARSPPPRAPDPPRPPAAHPRPPAGPVPLLLRIGAAAADLLRVPAAAAVSRPAPAGTETAALLALMRGRRPGRSRGGSGAVAGSGRRGRRDAMRGSARRVMAAWLGSCVARSQADLRQAPPERPSDSRFLWVDLSFLIALTYYFQQLGRNPDHMGYEQARDRWATMATMWNAPREIQSY